MDFDGAERCKRCGVIIGEEEMIRETLLRCKINGIPIKTEKVFLCSYCTKALDNFLNSNWRFEHG